MSSYEEWIHRVSKQPIPQRWRKEQFWFDKLSEASPEAAHALLNRPGCDPFYDDDNLLRFFDYVKHTWEHFKNKT